jgi:DNA (cytosine-5)-methyltransferase 1
MLSHFSLFSGVGGIDLAAEMAGFTTVGQCEFADYPTKVLEKYWPDVPRWRDVRSVTYESVRNRGIGDITLMSGGIPCQPHSVAGKRKASLDERDLWPEFRRIIGEFRPKWVLVENVPGLLSSEDGRFFGNILRDLAALGYSVGWCVYGADDVGANHKRDRAFIVGHAGSSGLSGEQWRGTGTELENGHGKPEKGNVADTECKSSGLEEHRHCGQSRELSKPPEPEILRQENGKGCTEGVGTSCKDVADTGSAGREEFNTSTEPTGQGYGPGSSNEDRHNRAIESGICRGFDGIPSRLYEHRWPALPGERQYEWEPPRVKTGVKNRVGRLKCLGNAVVPQQVYPILVAIAEMEGYK